MYIDYFYLAKYIFIVLCIIDSLRVGNDIFVFDSVCDNLYFVRYKLVTSFPLLVWY